LVSSSSSVQTIWLGCDTHCDGPWDEQNPETVTVTVTVSATDEAVKAVKAVKAGSWKIIGEWRWAGSASA
jgi:hypothetical protein